MAYTPEEEKIATGMLSDGFGDEDILTAISQYRQNKPQIDADAVKAREQDKVQAFTQMLQQQGASPQEIQQKLANRQQMAQSNAQFQQENPTIQPYETKSSKLFSGAGQDFSQGNYLSGALKGIGGAFNKLTEKTIEGYGNLGTAIGAATQGQNIGEALADPGAKFNELDQTKSDILGYALQAPLPLATGKLLASGGGLLKTIGAGALAGTEGMAQQAVLSEGRLPTKKELEVGAIGGAALGGAIKGVQKASEYLPAKLQLSGLINPAKLEKAQQTIIQEGEKSPEDVAKWMLDRNIVGSKDSIIKQLDKRAEEAKKTIDFGISQVGKEGGYSWKEMPTGVHQALDEMLAKMVDTPGLEQKAQDLITKYGKPKLTLSDINSLKRNLDAEFDIFKKAGYADIKAGKTAEGLANIRRQLKDFIETEATKGGFGNVKLLNNEIAVAKGLKEGIGLKENADYVRGLLSPFSGGLTGGAAGAYVGGPFPNTGAGRLGNILVGATVGAITGSTGIKTNAAKLLNIFNKKDISVLDKFLNKQGDLDEGTAKKVMEFVKNIKKIKEEGVNGLTPSEIEAKTAEIAKKQGKKAITTQDIDNMTPEQLAKFEAELKKPKLKPLKMDKITTFESNVEVGESPLTKVSTTENANDLIQEAKINELMSIRQKAIKKLPKFKNDLNDIGNSTGIKLSNTDDKWLVKGKDGILKKINQGRKTDDILRHTFIMGKDKFNTKKELIQNIKSKLENKGYKITEIEDRFLTRNSGYRDINIKMIKDKIPSEVQVMGDNLFDVKNRIGHHLYDQQQKLEEAVKNNPKLSKVLDYIKKSQERRYNEAINKDFGI